MASSQNRGPMSPGPKYYTAQAPMPQQMAVPVSTMPMQQVQQVSGHVPGAVRTVQVSATSYPPAQPGVGGPLKRPPVQQQVLAQQVQPMVQQVSGVQVAQARIPQQQQPAKKKRRLADKIIPPEIGDMVPEYHAYVTFMSFERKLDELITRKQLEIQEALKRPQKVKRRLRIYVSHTFYPGKAPEKENEEGQIAQWELRVEGRLIDDDPAKIGLPLPQQSSAAIKRRFSTFFKSLVIELDKEIYGPDNHLVEWHKNANETDGFQVKRLGDRNVKCTILLLLDHVPMKFKLDPRLARLLGIHTDTRPKIIESLWEYIKRHKLQDAHERDYINCDKYLEQTFQCPRMRFMEIPQRLSGLLLPPDPIVIHHLITCSSDVMEPKKTVCYDIDVEIDDPTKYKMGQFLNTLQNQNDLVAFDNKICDHVDQIKQAKMHRDFFTGFSQEPKSFIEKWIVSQSRDLKLVNEMNEQPEEERRAEYYQQPWVNEAVSRYLYSKVQQKRAELEQSLGIK